MVFQSTGPLCPFVSSISTPKKRKIDQLGGSIEVAKLLVCLNNKNEAASSTEFDSSESSTIPSETESMDN